jgi:predicted phosphodiesterase
MRLRLRILLLKMTCAALALLLLTGCSAPAPMPAPTAEQAIATFLPTAAPVPTNTPLPPTATPPAAPTIAAGPARGPYLQYVETDSIVIIWETENPSHGEVIYGETEEYGSMAVDPAQGTRHAVILHNLEPYTTYHYRVASDGAPISKDAAFRTAAKPSQTHFTFAVIGDTQSQYEYHQEIVRLLVALEPDFVLHVGDLVQNGDVGPNWEVFFDVERDLMARVPLYPVLGNHDRANDMFFDSFCLPGNERWYVFDYGNARFVCLEVDGIADFSPDSEQYAWLEKTLAANSPPWLFVFFHIPPYSSSTDASEQRVRDTLTPLFEQYGVDVVFNGHHHNYERNEANGVTYIVTGGGGGPLAVMEDQEPTQAAFAMVHHAVLLELDGDHLKGTAISADGRVLDEFQRNAR